ncbi:hypothetical protein Nepgr_007399 [Nepenthes gracilis]|uniref:Pentatricopeptide repeat-containing protein n=1 Tax=Nepenthes gracilis TaxID=150966 RepID=A0AAD3S742_NEPGR|nr:hypothetical protein Nepgr_007399 [Nepenthes gracilis]
MRNSSAEVVMVLFRCTLFYKIKLQKTVFQSPLLCSTINRPFTCTNASSSPSSGSYNRADNLAKLYSKDWLSPNEVQEIFKALDPNSVPALLDHVSKRKDYKPNEAFYTLVITKLGQVRNFDAIDDLLTKFKTQKNCRLSDDFFYNVLKIYGNVGGRINRAIETLYDMPKCYNCWPSVKTFNFVLNLLVSTKQFDIVHEVYLGAGKLGIEIDACCLNILIKGLCECGHLDDAYYVLDEFPKQGCIPNVRTFSTIMHGLCENGKVDKAFGLIERMENEDIYPDTITYNTLISGLQKQGRVEEAIELLDRMRRKGCNPNSGSYQQVLYGLLRIEEFALAKDFMNRMISNGFRPSFVSYKMMILGLCDGKKLEDADWVLKHMVRHGFAPKMGMWRKILEKMFSGNGSFDTTNIGEIIDKMFS